MEREQGKFWNPYVGGVALGLVLLATYALMGRGLGASGASFRAGVAVVHAIAPGHAQSVPAMASTLEDGNPLDDWLVFEVLGVVVGGFIGKLGGFFLYQWLHVPGPLLAVIIAILAAAAFAGASRIERLVRERAFHPRQPVRAGDGEATRGSEPHRGGTVLVTGASSGIGTDLARAFARSRRDLVLVARSRERLEELARELVAAHGVRVRVVVSDLASPGAAASIHATLRAEGVDVETLVNNAGFGLRGAFVELDARRQSDMIQVNVAAVTELCRVFAQDMVRRGSGRILNVAGLAGVMPGPGMAVYCATKAFVLSFTEALANELRGTGVTATCLSPGPTQTRFGDTAGFSALRLFRLSAPMPSTAIAEAGRAALERGAGLVVPGWRNRLLAVSVRLVPTRTAAAIARHMLESPPSEAKEVVAP
jgi:short-subunit dehydrogenase